MALTSTIELTTHRYIKDIYPGIDSSDTKERVYNWVSLGSDRYISYNSGLVTQLFSDGKELNPASTVEAVAGGRYKTLLTANIVNTNTGSSALYKTFTYNASFSTGSESDLNAGDYILVDKADGTLTEYVFVESVNTSANQINVSRGALGSGAITTVASGDNLEINSYLAVNRDFSWYYDSYLDHCILYSTTNPNDLIVESGEDASTLMTRMIRRSSRMVESLLDSRLAREIVKDREGNYPEFIQRATGLKVITMLLKSNDPENPIIESFEEEFNEIIEGYRSGTIQLPNAVTADSSKGVIREVSVSGSSDLRPVELRGNYNGVGYELLKLVIESGEGGAIGTAKMSVYGKDNNQLKNDLIVNSEIIDGDFQVLCSGVRIRWSGDDVATAVCTAGDEYEIELKGMDCEVSTSQVGSISLTRR